MAALCVRSSWSLNSMEIVTLDQQVFRVSTLMFRAAACAAGMEVLARVQLITCTEKKLLPFATCKAMTRLVLCFVALISQEAPADDDQ